MEESSARLVFYIILGAEAVAWVLAAHFALKGSGGQEGDILGGELETEGDPEELSKRVAESLASGRGFKLIERTGEKVAFERAVPGMISGPGHAVIDSGLITLEKLASGKVRIAYAAKIERLLRVTRYVLLPLLAAGLVVLCVIALVMWKYVIPSETPGVRGQVFQTFQAVHFLWPPWLIMGLRRRGRRIAKAYLETLISNAAFLGGGGRAGAAE